MVSPYPTALFLSLRQLSLALQEQRPCGCFAAEDTERLVVRVTIDEEENGYPGDETLGTIRTAIPFQKQP